VGFEKLMAVNMGNIILWGSASYGLKVVIADH
jgi:hypothetical protein